MKIKKLEKDLRLRSDLLPQLSMPEAIEFRVVYPTAGLKNMLLH
jgi:hypothetical protein